MGCKIIFHSVISVFIFFAAVIFTADAYSDTISAFPTQVSVSSGQSASVSLVTQLDQATPVYSLLINLTYDSSMLSISSISAGAGTQVQGCNMVTNTSTAGQAVIGVYCNTALSTGSVQAVIVNFTVSSNASGNVSPSLPLTLTCQFNELTPVASQTYPGYFSVNSTAVVEQGLNLNAQNNLIAIVNAQINFKNQTGTYCTAYDLTTATINSTCGTSLANLDTNLNLNIVDNNFTYSCIVAGTPLHCSAQRTTGTTQDIIDLNLSSSELSPYCVYYSGNPDYCPTTNAVSVISSPTVQGSTANTSISNASTNPITSTNTSTDINTNSNTSTVSNVNTPNTVIHALGPVNVAGQSSDASYSSQVSDDFDQTMNSEDADSIGYIAAQGDSNASD